MSKINIAIVEDEMINAETLNDMLEDLGYEIYGKFMRAEKAWEAFQKKQPDFALLDIRLKGEKTGIWLAEQIKNKYDFPYIYLTSFGDKSTIEEAANTNAYGYLMKPIEKQNLHASIEIALKRFSAYGPSSDQDSSNDENELQPIKNALFIKDEYYYSKVLLDDILYIKSDDNYLEIYTTDKKHLVRGTLKTFYNRLPAQKFLQVHRSYVINVLEADGFGANFVKIGEESIPVSKAYQDDLKKQFEVF